MRIDNNRANFDRVETAKNAAVETTKKDGATRTEQGSADSITLSSSVQFAAAAATAAASAPELRQDKIERAKAMLADGTLGSDPGKLADALIDRALIKE